MRWLDTNTVPPALGEAAEVVAEPADAVGVEAVGRLVEQQDLRVAEQRAGQGQTLPHAEGEPAGALVGGRSRARPRRGPRSTRPAGMPLMAAMARRWFRAVRPGCMQRASRTDADQPGRVLGGRCSGRRRSGPRRRSGRVSPTIIRMVVDLPAPFGPTKPVTRPAATVKVRSSTAVRSP